MKLEVKFYSPKNLSRTEIENILKFEYGLVCRGKLEKLCVEGFFYTINLKGKIEFLAPWAEELWFVSKKLKSRSKDSMVVDEMKLYGSEPDYSYINITKKDI